jgi:hypothetical protein
MTWIEYTNPLLAPLNLSADADKERACLILEGTQQFIERYCHRQISQGTYVEQQTVRQDGSVILKQFPVQQILRCQFFNMGWLTVASSAQVATVSTTPTGVTLMSIANGVQSTTALTYAQYPTLNALAAAINAVAGYTAGMDAYHGSYPSADIVSPQFGTCSGTSPTTLAQWEDYVGSFDVQPSGIIWSMLPLGLATGYSTPTAVPLNMYRDFRALITYTAGFSVIPSDICMVMANLAMAAFNGGKEVQTERLGDWSYTFFAPEKLTMGDRRILDSYKSRRA